MHTHARMHTHMHARTHARMHTHMHTLAGSSYSRIARPQRVIRMDTGHVGMDKTIGIVWQFMVREKRRLE